jgi:hypothetical protein
MEGIQAKIQGEGIDSSVEFSVEEVVAHHRGPPWGEMSAADREAEMKDYALALFQRQNGVTGNLRVTLEKGTFSKVREDDV